MDILRYDDACLVHDPNDGFQGAPVTCMHDLSRPRKSCVVLVSHRKDSALTIQDSDKTLSNARTIQCSLECEEQQR